MNELVDLARKSKKFCLIFKVDFKKSCSSISWCFLDYMLIRYGFNEKWRPWMLVCVFFGNLAVLVNGCLTQEISIQRGWK